MYTCIECVLWHAIRLIVIKVQHGGLNGSGVGGGGGDLESFLLDMDKKSWLVRAVYRNFARGGGSEGPT